MLAIHIIHWLFLCVEVGMALPILYLSLLSVSAIRQTKKQKNRDVSSLPTEQTNFAILIPAHNEESILATLLASLEALSYPKDHYSVYVVADNCTDTTASLARASDGIQVYERFDQEKRGKGYALSWVLQRLEEDHRIHDAYIILDADSVVIPTFLQSLDRELQKGAKALQACNTVLNSTESASTALRWLALTLVNHVRPLGRNGLGASSTLTGNGMCLRREILQRYPWQAFALAEDYQYYLNLVENGERVRYVPDAIVRSHMPTTFAQMRTQDVRWESSGADHRVEQIALRLIKASLKARDFGRLEAVAELFTPPLSLLVSSCLLIFVVALVLQFLPGLLLSFLLLAGLITYIGTAFYLLRPPRAVYVALAHAPFFMIWKLWVYFVLGRSKKHTSEWIRTSRSTLAK